MMFSLPELTFILPEIVMAFGALITLLVGVFYKQDGIQICLHICLGIILGVLFLELNILISKYYAFNKTFVIDYFSIFCKTLILGGSFLVLFSTRDIMFHEKIGCVEYPILILLSALGMMIMVSANTFLILFMGLELQSLSLYILTAMRRDHLKSSEAGLKYFILGALSTGLFLYGVSFLYGLTGSLDFGDISYSLLKADHLSLLHIISMGFIIAGLIFKISLVPFHMWAPDVYEGAPLCITAFLSTIPKIAALAIIVRIFSHPMASSLGLLQPILMVICALSMILGVFAALFQTNIKRLIAYSSIANMGYLMIGFIISNIESIQALLVYLTIYILTLIGLFVCIINISRKGAIIENIKDLKGLWQSNPGTTFALSFFLFSLAGIPPLAGFLGKLYIFEAALKNDLTVLAILGVLTSVIGASYYLWIIKVMVMDEPATPPSSPTLVNYSRSPVLTVILTGIIFVLTWIFIKPSFLMSTTLAVSSSLFFK